MSIVRMTSIAVGLASAGYMVSRLFQPAVESASTRPMAKVRDAGPDNMHAPPGKWDMVDQQADESFPASDPPGNY